jgi:6,7-dimethyl-8-ribityllumazine synthase
MSEHHDEPQDWPLRDWSTRLRPPGRPPEEDSAREAADDAVPDAGLAGSGADEPALAEEPAPAGEAALVETPAPAGEAEILYEEPAEGAVVELPAEPVEGPEPPAEAERQHAEGELYVPDGYPVLEGAPTGERRSVAIVVSRFNAEITSRLLESALAELEEAGVAQEAVLVMPVPGAFELPIAAMALAKTRRYSCVVALGCVIRGETPHFEYVAAEAASGLQLAGIETGVPVSFGVLTCDTAEQAEARVGKGAVAVRSGLEMADAFAQLRTAAAAARQ